jgi:TRAP-type mannitol/chloroaromatic compound transport system permease small subunit
MTRWLEAISRRLAWLAGGLILLAALLIGLDVVLRNLLRIAPFHSFELSRYGFGAALALGMAFAVTERANIRIDLLHRGLAARWHGALDLLALAGLVPVALAFAWYAWAVCGESLRLGAASNTPLAVPLAIPQAVFALGLSWFTLVAALYTLAAARALLRGDAATVERLGGMPGLAAEAGDRPA